MDVRDGTVFVSEDDDERDPYIWPGRFSAHWESDDGARSVDGPRGVTLDEALAWGRARADVVLVRPGDADVPFSAGTRRPEGDGDDEQLPRWPDARTVARRRHPGMEHLDISAVHSLPWAVRLPMARRVADALSADATVCDLRVEQGAPPDETVVHFSVLARTHAEALELVLASERRAYDAAGSGRDPGRPPEDLSAAFETAWNPYDDIRPLDESLTRP